MFKSTNSAGIGVIIRDCGGSALGALTMPVPLSSSVAELEALACRRAAQFAIEIRPRKVIFEGDSAEVIQAISQGNSDFSVYGNILEDIRLQAAGLEFYNFCHVNRKCNIVAGALAQKAKNCMGLEVWFVDLSEDIAPLILSDVH